LKWNTNSWLMKMRINPVETYWIVRLSIFAAGAALAALGLGHVLIPHAGPVNGGGVGGV
jgi:uncharacterized membrane-anchored protein YitT (DUF2179 family)